MCIRDRHIANWCTYMCRVRRCKPMAANHVNMLTDNEWEKYFYYCNHYVWFNVSVMSWDLQTSHLSLVSAAEANVSVSRHEALSSFNVSCPSLAVDVCIICMHANFPSRMNVWALYCMKQTNHRIQCPYLLLFSFHSLSEYRIQLILAFLS